MHEVLHALGVAHEHQRPDRDDTIIVDDAEINLQYPSLADQFTKLPSNGWWDSSHDLEIGSSMMYPSILSTGDNPVMVLKSDGTTQWGNHGAMTTTDALQEGCFVGAPWGNIILHTFFYTLIFLHTYFSARKKCSFLH